MSKRTTPKHFSVLLLLVLCTAPPALCAEKAGAASRFSTRLHAARATNDREQDGLAGPVRRVKTETAKITVKNGQPVEGPRTVLESITYDNKGGRVDSAYFLTAGGTLTGKEIYKYDERGNMVEMTLHDTDGSLLAKEIYSYEFDAVGNWVKMTTAVAVVEGGKLTFEPTEVTYRTIAYFLEEKTATKLSQPVAQAPAKPAAATPQPASALAAQPLSAPPSAAATSQPAATRPTAGHTPSQTASAQSASSQTGSPQSALSQSSTPAGAPPQTMSKAAHKAADVTADKLAAKPVEKPSEKPVERPAEKPAQTVTDKLAEKAPDGGVAVAQQVAAVSRDRGAAVAPQPAPAAPSVSQPNPSAETAVKTEATKTEAEPAAQPAGESAARPVVRGPLKPISGGILNGKAISLPAPQYPEMARRAAVSGIVEVEVVIDVSGKVISAKASKGPVMLQQAAEQAARQAKFVPTLLSGQPVKVSGSITYNFTLR